MTRAGERARAAVTALSIRDDQASTSGRYPPTDDEDCDGGDLRLNPVAGRRWVDPRARWVAASLAPHIHADSPEHARDVLTATVLCECSYKSPESHVRERVAELSREFPPFAVRLSGVSASVEGRARRRYLVAHAPGVTYVAFTGTREAMDFLADASFLQTPLLEGLGLSSSDGKLGSDVKSTRGTPMVHRGFAARARELRAPVRAVWRHARKRGDRLVLCGHSLGGAVAALAAVTLLAEADEDDAAGETLRCIAFASPPVGNSAMRRVLCQRGWDGAFTNVCVPEDPVPRLLFTPARQRAAAASAAASLARGVSAPVQPYVSPAARPRSPPSRDSSRDVNAARRLPRLVPLAVRAEDEEGDGKVTNSSKSSYLRAAGRVIRPEYVHLGPIHHLGHGGYVVVRSDTDDVASDTSITDDTRESAGAIAAVRHAVLRHAMRTYRARMVDLCRRVVKSPRSSPTSLPRPVDSAVGIVPNPKPSFAVAVVSASADGAAFAAAAAIRGNDLDLCNPRGGVKAEVRGWPCVVSSSPMGTSATTIIVRVSAPMFNGEKLPVADAGGPSAFGWEPMILSCGGDFGDSRVPVRVVPRRVWVRILDDTNEEDAAGLVNALREMDGGWIDFKPAPVEPRWRMRRLLGYDGAAPAPGDVVVVVTDRDVPEDVVSVVRVTPRTNVVDARRALLRVLATTERDALAYAVSEATEPKRGLFRSGFTFGAAAAAGAAFGAALRRDLDGEG